MYLRLITRTLFLCISAHPTVLLLSNPVLNLIFLLLPITSSHSHASALDSTVDYWRYINTSFIDIDIDIGCKVYFSWRSAFVLSTKQMTSGNTFISELIALSLIPVNVTRYRNSPYRRRTIGKRDWKKLRNSTAAEFNAAAGCVRRQRR